MQYEIRLTVRAVDIEDDSQDAYVVMVGEWENISDAVTDLAHHIDGTRPNDSIEKCVLPDSETMEHDWLDMVDESIRLKNQNN